MMLKTRRVTALQVHSFEQLDLNLNAIT